MLSTLDALIGTPLDELLAGLPLAETVSDAVLHRGGPLGAALSAATRIGEGEGAQTPSEADALRDALVWADRSMPPRDAG
jgi:c-di-GMP-related signal transduction protein